MKEQKIGPHGHKVVAFNSLEEVMQYMEENEHEAIENTLDEQWQIKWGAYVFRMSDDLVIFGRVFTEQEFLEENLSEHEDAEHDREIHEELGGLRDAYVRGYRYGRYYSIVEPDGELGSAHVVTLWEISQDDFEIARRNDWNLSPYLALKVHDETIAAMKRRDDDAANRAAEERR